MIVFFFGENYPEYMQRDNYLRSQKDDAIKLHQITEDIFNNFYDKIKEAFLHLVFVGYGIKKKTKKNKFLKLSSVANRFLLIDLLNKGKNEDVLNELHQFI